MKCQILFSRKKKEKKNTISLSSAESAHSVVHVSVKEIIKVHLICHLIVCN